MKKQFSNQLRAIADEMDRCHLADSPAPLSDEMIEKVHETFIRPIMESRILKNNEVARKLHVSPSTVAALINAKKLTTTVDGKVTEYHLRLYLSNQKDQQ